MVNSSNDTQNDVDNSSDNIYLSKILLFTNDTENVDLNQEQPKVFESKAQVLTLEPVGLEQNHDKTDAGAMSVQEDTESKVELKDAQDTNGKERAGTR